jgi:hypothetical protein
LKATGPRAAGEVFSVRHAARVAYSHQALASSRVQR